MASSSVHRSTSSQRGECEELEQPQPSVAEAMTLLGELMREMDALRTKSESQEKMITALSKSIEDVKREQSTPSQSVRSKAVPKDLLVSSNLFYYVYKIYTQQDRVKLVYSAMDNADHFNFFHRTIYMFLQVHVLTSA